MTLPATLPRRMVTMTQSSRDESDSNEPRSKPGRNLFRPSEWERLGNILQLSPRELEILQAVFDDLSEPVIAKRLDLSVHTVHTYLKRLYQKLDARSRVEVVCTVVAVERGMLRRHERDGEVPIHGQQLDGE